MMNNKEKHAVPVWILYALATVLVTSLMVGILYFAGPRKKNGFEESALCWGFIPLISDPVTYDENSPYMQDYKVLVDRDNRCICLCISISGRSPIVAPDKHLIFYANGKGYLAYKAPFDYHRESENDISSYRESVRDDSIVYTCQTSEQNALYLRIMIPMTGEFRDPADLNTMELSLAGISDDEGNQIIQDEGHSDWIMLVKEMGFESEIPDIFVEMDEIRKIQAGKTAHIYIGARKDGMTLLDVSDPNNNSRLVTDDFRISGFEADTSWSKTLSDTGDELIAVELSNIRNITGDKVTIQIPANLASGWIDRVYHSSDGMTVSIYIDGGEGDMIWIPG